MNSPSQFQGNTFFNGNVIWVIFSSKLRLIEHSEPALNEFQFKMEGFFFVFVIPNISIADCSKLATRLSFLRKFRWKVKHFGTCTKLQFFSHVSI